MAAAVNEQTGLRGLPAWRALEEHHEAIGGRHLRDLFAEDPARGERLAAEAEGIYLDYSKHRVTDETLALLVRLAEETGVAERRDAMFRGERINVTEDRAVLHVALRMPRERSLLVDGRDVVRDVHEVLDRMAAFSDAGSLGRVAGSHRQADPQRREHRDRRLRPRAGHGLPGAPRLQPPGPDVPLRVERRRHRHRRGDARPRPAGDALRGLLEDVHDARDADERRQRARVGAPDAEGRRRDREALRRRVHERRRGGGVRDRRRQHVRLLGLGRRPLLDGLRHRPLDDARALGQTRSATCSPASTRSTSTSARRHWSGTCPC